VGAPRKMRDIGSRSEIVRDGTLSGSQFQQMMPSSATVAGVPSWARAQRRMFASAACSRVATCS